MINKRPKDNNNQTPNDSRKGILKELEKDESVIFYKEEIEPALNYVENQNNNEILNEKNIGYEIKKQKNGKTKNIKDEIDNCIISHKEFNTKPPVYDIDYPLLLNHQNKNYVIWLLKNHHSFYIKDNSKINTYIPTAILVYSLSNKESKIFKLDEFAKKFNIDILNSKTEELTFDTINIQEKIELKKNLNDDFISLLNDGINIDFDKYNNYFLVLLKVVTTEERKYYRLFNIKAIDTNVL